MAAGDRAAGDIADDVAGAAFMRRIAGGKMRGNGMAVRSPCSAAARMAASSRVACCVPSAAWPPAIKNTSS